MKISESFKKNLPIIRLIVFDVDGVLIDTSRSFPEAIARALLHYAKMEGFKNWDKPAEEVIAAFKTIPGFNNDWDLEEGILVFYLQQEALENPLSLASFLDACAKRGGGMAGVKAWLEELSEKQQTFIKEHFRADLIRRLAMEYYAGEQYCQRLYGFSPKYVRGSGTLELEKSLVNLEKLRALGKSYTPGIYSGRSREELDLIGGKIGLSLFPPDKIVVDDGIQPIKPSPEPIYRMLNQMKAPACVFIGDSFDDFQTAVRFSREYPEMFCEFVQVTTTKEPFSESISVVANVNQLLDYLMRN